MSKRFARRIEDFVCAHCGADVAGDGYTNHCPRCLRSAHVDIDPGDRAEDCGGTMDPVGLEVKAGKTTLIHRCRECGAERRCRTAPDDDKQALLALARDAAEAAIGRKPK